jgi:hypothetical protein
MGQQIFVWSGKQPFDAEETRRNTAALPCFPAPTPLPRAILIHYRWGDSSFEIAVLACSIRIAPWGNEQVTWLHCKAIETVDIRPGEPGGVRNVLIPADYVTSVGSGPTFRFQQRGISEDIGLFPPNQPTPPDALPLDEVERLIASCSRQDETETGGKTMAGNLPLPLVQSFLVCRDIFQDRQTGEYLLLGPCTGMTLPGFPVAVNVALYIKLTGGHGTYHLEVQLRDHEGGLVGSCPDKEPLHLTDPLASFQISWRQLALQFPRPGRYDLILLANGEDLAHHALDIILKAT